MNRESGNLLAVVLGLVSIGIVMVWSTSAIEADRKIGDPTFFLRRQVLWALLAAIALALAWATDYRRVLSARVPLLGAVAVALVLVLLTPAVNGANLRTRFDAQGNAVAVTPCHAGWRTPDSDDCLAPVAERAWSSPIFVDRP